MTLIAATAVSVCLTGSPRAESLPPGQVDFGDFAPPSKGGQFVEVNIPSSLIAMAARFVEKHEPDVAQVLKGLQLVRVNVVGCDDQNRTELQERAQKVRSELNQKGWERLVMARNQGQDVSVYVKTQDKDTVQGLVVIAVDASNQAVFVNIVGDIKPDKLAMLGDKLNIEPLKKLGGATEK